MESNKSETLAELGIDDEQVISWHIHDEDTQDEEQEARDAL